MWNRIASWYKDWEAEQMHVLEHPQAAAGTAPGYRRYVALKLAALSEVERMQIHAFALKYRGWRMYAALAKLVVVFTLLGALLYLAWPKKGLMPALVTANVLGFVGLTLMSAAWFNYRKVVGKIYRVIVVTALCGGLGAMVGMTHAALEKGQTFSQAVDKMFPTLYYIIVGILAVLVLPMVVVSMLRNKQYEMLTAKLAADAEHQRMARELSEARLRVLSAQIEPHFLFNTLGAVQQLAEQDAPRAAALTSHLIAFLRASLDEMRSDKVTLAKDFALVASYLEVMQARLGSRLAYALDLPATLAAESVPSMMLLTLVENAIKHGIEPALRGGSIAVTASAGAGMLRLRVQDSGAGMSDTPGAGDGLDNIRKRLQLCYGAAAALSLEDADGGGFVAELLIPLDLKAACP